MDKVNQRIREDHEKMMDVTQKLDNQLNDTITKVKDNATQRIDKLYEDMMAQIGLV